MPLHFARPPEASTNALEAALPAVARRASIATHAPAINSGIVSHLRRRRGEAPAAAREPIAAPVHVIGLDADEFDALDFFCFFDHILYLSD